jgi:hypothetical protein
MVILPSVLAAAVLAAPGPSSFDSARDHRVVPLRTDRQGFAAGVTCDTYDGFMVKVVDRGEKGAERLALVRFDPRSAPPACDDAAAPGEVVLASWSGYFAGARSHYVFFHGDDGWEAGSTGFAVYDVVTGKKVLEDAAVPDVAAARIDHVGGGLRMRYRRAWRADCSLLGDPGSCWKKIAALLGLEGAPPACAGAYAREKAPQDDPSVLLYDAEVTLGASAVHPVNARARPECWPGM